MSCPLHVYGGEDYYALFMGDTYREIHFNFCFLTASVLRGSKIQFLFNGRFLQLEEREAVAMIKHEILHILLKHHGREKALRISSENSPSTWPWTFLNQYINHLLVFVERINSVNMNICTYLKAMNETLEYYTEEIDQAIMEHPKAVKELLEKDQVNYEEVHDRWVESG